MFTHHHLSRVVTAERPALVERLLQEPRAAPRQPSGAARAGRFSGGGLARIRKVRMPPRPEDVCMARPQSMRA
jgi:hypothetical protein